MNLMNFTYSSVVIASSTTYLISGTSVYSLSKAFLITSINCCSSFIVDISYTTTHKMSTTFFNYSLLPNFSNSHNQSSTRIYQISILSSHLKCFKHIAPTKPHLVSLVHRSNILSAFYKMSTAFYKIF